MFVQKDKNNEKEAKDCPFFLLKKHFLKISSF